MAPRRRRLVAGDGTGLAIEEEGAGRPVVLVPGLGYAAWSWAMQRSAVAQVGRALVLDNRGSGRSDKPPAPYSIGRMAADVADVIEDAGGGPAVVVGASMGGCIALTLALARPDLVRSLVLISTSIGGPDSVPLPEETRSAWLAAAHLPPEEYARATMPLSFAPGWTDDHPEQFEALLAARLEHPTPAEAWKAQYDACEAFLAEGLSDREITVPTWVAHGVKDRIVPFENAEVTCRRISQAELVEMGCGHLCAQERSHLVNRMLVEAAER
ncbi:MAG: alpha/beta hydrolase [Nocardioidaceae bacterium]